MGIFTADLWWLIPCLIALGAAAGFLSGLLGVGGGIVLVPGLLYVFGTLGFASENMMYVAVGTSLSIIIPTGFTAARAHYKKDAFDKDVFKKIGFGIFLGVILGTLLVQSFSGQQLKSIFAIVIGMLSCTMLFNINKLKLWTGMPKQPWTSFYGLFSGCISTLIGIGGATMNVPFMSISGVSMRKAVGTSSALGLLISIPAMLGFVLIGWTADGRPPLSLGYVNVIAFLCIVPLSTLVAPYGAEVAHKVSLKRLRQIFGIFMVIVAIKMWMMSR